VEVLRGESSRVEGQAEDPGKRVEKSKEEKREWDEPKKDAGKSRQVYRYTSRQKSAPAL